MTELSWPLVGRDHELASIRGALDATRGAVPGPGVLLVGAPGVGKTRLLRAAAAQARSDGYRVEAVAATRAAATIPLGAMSHLLPAELPPEQPHTAKLAAASPWLFRQIEDQLGGLGDGGAAAGTSGRRDAPVLLAVDDAHELDEASAALVHHIAVRGIATVLATMRLGEPAPDAVVALWKDELVQRLVVAPLPSEAIDDLLGRALNGRVGGAVRIQLRRLAAGNPLFLRELVMGGMSSGALHHEGRMWQLRGALTGDGRLDDLVEARLGNAGKFGRVVIELVALGEPVPLALLEPLPGLSDAEKVGLVEVVQDGRRSLLRLAHPVYGEVLRANLGTVRTREAYRRLVARQRTTPLRRRDDLLRIAAWQLAAGAAPDPPILLPAARQAAARYDLALAERLARAAAESHDPVAVRLLAEILRWQGRAAESVALLSGELTERTGDEQARRQVIKANSLYWGLARRAEGREALRQAPGQPGSEPTRAMMLLFDARCEDAMRVGRASFESEVLSAEARRWACSAAVLAAAHLGHVALALDLAAQGLRLPDEPREEGLLARPYLRLSEVSAMVLGGRLATARAAAESGYAQATAISESGLTATWAGLLGMVCQIQGDLAAARAALCEAVALDEQQDPTGLRGYHLAVQAGVLAQSGDLDGARAALRHLDSARLTEFRIHAPQIELNRARVLAAAGTPGALDRAARLALDAAATAERSGQRCVEAYALYEAARCGAAGRVNVRLAKLSGALDSELFAGYAAAAGALATGDPDALSRAATRLEELGAVLSAAHTALAASRAYRHGGRQYAASQAQERALVLEARGRGTPVLRLVAGARGVLTAREREIAELAAAGNSGPAIADRLHLSVRTVNNHLHRVYTKLGITGRKQLAAVLRRDL